MTTGDVNRLQVTDKEQGKKKADPQLTLILSDTAGLVPCARDTLDAS